MATKDQLEHDLAEAHEKLRVAAERIAMLEQQNEGYRKLVEELQSSEERAYAALAELHKRAGLKPTITAADVVGAIHRQSINVERLYRLAVGV